MSLKKSTSFEEINNCLFDVVIVGGGISGLYTAMKLSNKYNVCLLDERDYWGGRIITNKKPHYEIGAARFNTSHKLLLSLIRKFSLTPIQLNTEVDYIDRKTLKLIPNIHTILSSYFKIIIKESNKVSKTKLQNMTLYEFIVEILDKEQANIIVMIFGYNSEITKMNAYQAIEVFKTDFVSEKYFVLKEGLSSLCNCIVKILKQNKVVLKNESFVEQVVKNDSSCEVYRTIFRDKLRNNKKCVVFSRKVVFAIKSHQVLSFPILKPIHKYVKNVYQSPLLRVYVKYPINKGKPWFHDLRRTTTNGILRQIIPIDYKTGLIMIAYVDGVDINKLRDKKTGNVHKDEKLLKVIQNELYCMFPYKKIPSPLYFKSHYWSEGAHHWKPNCDPDFVSRAVLNPAKNIYVCGEAFSLKQAWVEGGLQTSSQVVKIINNSM